MLEDRFVFEIISTITFSINYRSCEMDSEERYVKLKTEEVIKKIDGTIQKHEKQNSLITFFSTSSVLGLLSACGGGGGTSPISNSNDDNYSEDLSSHKPSLASLAHEVNGTTHFTGLSSLVTEPYEGYPTFINGDFDFTNLEVDYSKFEFSSEVGPKYELTEGYTGMVYYGNYGDVTGDGKPDMVISGWTVNTGNSSGRIFILEIDPKEGITDIQWTENEGTAAPWVEDFDGDGVDEIMSIGFYDFPVAPAPTIYFDNGLDNGKLIGPSIDSHESSLVDYDNDGDLDVVAIAYNNVNGLISLYENTGDGFVHSYLPKDMESYFATGSSIEYADLDGDGQGEFIVGDFAGDGGIAILKLNNDDTFYNSPDWRKVLEIRPYFEQSVFDGINSIFSSSNPSATEDDIIKLRSHDIVLKAIDIDLDGDLDILNSTSIWHDSQSLGVLQILINDGSGNFSDETDERLWNYSLAAEASHDLVFIDINNDGFLDIFTPEAGGNSTFHELGAGVDKANFNEGNTILLNDGTGHFLQIMFAPFSQKGTFKEDGHFYPNKWYPIIHSDGSLGYVNLDNGWTNYPNGEYDLFNYAHFDQTLYTGPKFVNPAEYGAAGFNEFYVLRNNPDVQEMVNDGTYGSALEWYLETRPSNIDTFAPNAKVVGSGADDTIVLREGNETAVGYGGNDSITGGDGADIFVFTKGENGTDTITDFSFADGDKIDLTSYGISSEEVARDSISDDPIISVITEGGIVRYDETAAVALTIDGNVVAHFYDVAATDFLNFDGWLA